MRLCNGTREEGIRQQESVECGPHTWCLEECEQWKSGELVLAAHSWAPAAGEKESLEVHKSGRLREGYICVGECAIL